MRKYSPVSRWTRTAERLPEVWEHPGRLLRPDDPAPCVLTATTVRTTDGNEYWEYVVAEYGGERYGWTLHEDGARMDPPDLWRELDAPDPDLLRSGRAPRPQGPPPKDGTRGTGRTRSPGSKKGLRRNLVPVRVLYDVIDDSNLVTDSAPGMLQLNRRARCGACGQPKEGKLAWRRIRQDRFHPFMNGPFDRKSAVCFIREQAGRLGRKGGTLVVQITGREGPDGPYAVSPQHTPEALDEFRNSQELEGMPKRLRP